MNGLTDNEVCRALAVFSDKYADAPVTARDLRRVLKMLAAPAVPPNTIYSNYQQARSDFYNEVLKPLNPQDLGPPEFGDEVEYDAPCYRCGNAGPQYKTEKVTLSVVAIDGDHAWCKQGDDPFNHDIQRKALRVTRKATLQKGDFVEIRHRQGRRGIFEGMSAAGMLWAVNSSGYGREDLKLVARGNVATPK